MLKSPLPAAAMRGMGLAVAAALTLGAATMAWSAQPGAIAAGPGAAQRAEAQRDGAAHPTYSCDPVLEAKGVGCKVIPLAKWRAMPTPRDFARLYPPGAAQAGQTARVRVACKTTIEGLMKACTVASVSVQIPAGEGATQATQDAFGEAALKLAVLYQANIPDLPAASRRDGGASFFIDIGKFQGAAIPPGGPPLGFAEPRGAPALHSIWLKKPTMDDMVRLYPADAVAKGLTGEVLMACRVGADGRLNACETSRIDVSGTRAPDPSGDPGFGPASLELSKLFQMEPTTPAGQPTAGTLIRIPVRFALPRSADAAPAPR